MAPDNTPPKPEPGKEGPPPGEPKKPEAASDAAAAGAAPATPPAGEPKKGSEMSPEEKAKAIEAAKAKAAAAKAEKAKAEPEIREGKQIAGGVVNPAKKGEKVNKEAVIAAALEKIRLTEQAILAKPPAPEISRREFFMKTGWLGFLTFMLFLGGCFARFFFPRVLFEPPTKFKAGFPNEYTVGEVSTKYKDLYRTWVIREAAGFYAVFARCTHLGCTPMWLEGEQKFKCPCHGSGYTKEAINYEGPAPRPMERCFIGLADDGQLLVDTSKRYRYEEGQWEDKGAYLRV
jgi:cytochrome b6-f complex iron-sulfur subunit